MTDTEIKSTDVLRAKNEIGERSAASSSSSFRQMTRESAKDKNMNIREFLFSQQHGAHEMDTNINMNRSPNRVAETVEKHYIKKEIGFAPTTTTTTTTTYCNRINYVTPESVTATIAACY